MGGLVVEADDLRRDDVSRLLEQHRLFASGVMPPDGVHVLDPDGVGRALVDHLVAVAAARGVRRVSLECGAGEAFVPARSLYAGAGFVPCGPFAEYEATPDNVFMTRVLG